eukprot:TRINITY_DN47338_c0_g1_i1.p1 TRINITY_DN47338_c0_g1~~TRINITY_DN47338_c0_g1_i1.p1  ORF type:complete len:497 (+),score=133.53 TRINITY_DN47338_c0_g1_i1:55-1491(+)
MIHRALATVAMVAYLHISTVLCEEDAVSEVLDDYVYAGFGADDVAADSADAYAHDASFLADNNTTNNTPAATPQETTPQATPAAIPEAGNNTPSAAPTAETPEQNATTPEQNATAPHVETPQSTPEAKTPEETNQTTPEAKTPEANQTTPEAKTPEANQTTPEAKTPEANQTTPETKTPEAKTPEAKTPEAKTPEMTPEVVPMAPEMTPEATPASLEPLKWCLTDTACRSLGDAAATCNMTTFECQCSSGFSHITEGNVTAYLCAQGNVAHVVHVVMSLVFNIDCTVYDPAVQKPMLISLVQDSVGGTVSSFLATCGSLVVATKVDGVNPITLATTDLAAAVNGKLSSSKYAALKSALGSVSSVTADVGGSSCTVLNADTTVLLPSGTCIPLSCDSGYELSNSTCSLRTATVVVSDDDDSLSPSAVAGIVVGVIAGVGLIAAVAYYFITSSSSSDIPTGEHEPITSDHEPVHTAGDEV